MARFVGQMSVHDLCAQLGCSVEELLVRAKGRGGGVGQGARAGAAKSGARLEESLEELPFREARAEFDRRYVKKVLEACGGRRAEASRRAGMSRSMLYEILSRS